MQSSRQLRSQLRAADSPTAKKVILAQLKIAKRKEQQEETDLRTQIRSCRRCGLNRGRKNAVPWSGPTRGNADLIFVGEAPGAHEDDKGIPFIGQAGKMLDKAIHQAGSSRDRCFVMNNLCCRPPNNRDPKKRELEACQPNFLDQLGLADCAVGVTLGAYATANVTKQPRNKVSMGSVRGTPVWVDGRIWVPTYHPAYILRNRSEFWTLVDDIKFALALRFSEDKPLPTPIWEQVEFDGKPTKGIGPSIEKKGYAFIHSKTLNTQIVITRDEGVRVPQKLQHLPAYTVDELIHAGLLGKGRHWDRASVQRLHMVRSEFNGTVIAG